MVRRDEKIAFIAGAGGLAAEIIDYARENNIALFAIAIDGISDSKTIKKSDAIIGLGEIGKAIKLATDAGATKIAIAGYVKRPDFSKIKFDAIGLKLLPKIIASAKSGDDAIMRAVLSEFESSGLELIGPEKILEDLIAPHGCLTKAVPSENDFQDIEKAARILKSIGEFDIGQAIVVCDGVVLAIEAQEGTDQMVGRIKSLAPHLIGNQNSPRGVLVKASKTIQEKRIDLPVIGLTTLHNAHERGLKGIAIEAGAALISQKDKLIEFANECGMFILGFNYKDFPHEQN